MNAPSLPVDPVLPRLPQALNPAAMAEAFDALLRPRGQRVRACTVERIKYRPRRNCTLSYRLAVHEEDSGLDFDQHVAARLGAPDDLAARARKPPAWALTGSRAGPSFGLLPGMDLLCWWWPNDAKLLAPRVLADARRMSEEVLPGLLRHLRPGARLCGHTVTLAQYVPEHRVTARVDLQLERGGAPHPVYAKGSLEPGTAEAHALLGALQDSPAWREGRLRTPQALALQPGHGLHWQSALRGVPMLGLAPARALALMPSLGTQLAALHGTALPLTRVLTPRDDRERLQAVASVFDLAWPELQATSRRLRQGLEAGLDAVHAGPRCSLHGDLHPRNLLVDGPRLGLIDLDGLRAGPAVFDLGAWVADGIYRALLERAPALRDRPAWQACLEAYEEATGTALPAAELAWATAWALGVQRAWRCVVNLKPGRWDLVPALLAWAETLVGPQGPECLR